MTEQKVRLIFEIFFEARTLFNLFDGSLWVCYPKRMEVPMEAVSLFSPETFGGLEVDMTTMQVVNGDVELRLLVDDDGGCEHMCSWGTKKDSDGLLFEDRSLGYGKLFKVSQGQLQFSTEEMLGEDEKWNKTTGMTEGEVIVRRSIGMCKPGCPLVKTRKKGRKKRDGAILGTTQFSRGVVLREFTLSGKGELEVLGTSAVHAMRNGMFRMKSFVKHSMGVKVIQ